MVSASSCISPIDGMSQGGDRHFEKVFIESTGSHAAYPRVYEQEVASNLVKQHFHQLIPQPIYTSDMFLVEPACLEKETGLSQGRFTNASSYEWHSTPEFSVLYVPQLCRAEDLNTVSHQQSALCSNGNVGKE